MYFLGNVYAYWLDPEIEWVCLRTTDPFNFIGLTFIEVVFPKIHLMSILYTWMYCSIFSNNRSKALNLQDNNSSIFLRFECGFASSKYWWRNEESWLADIFYCKPEIKYMNLRFLVYKKIILLIFILFYYHSVF